MKRIILAVPLAALAISVGVYALPNKPKEQPTSPVTVSKATEAPQVVSIPEVTETPAPVIEAPVEPVVAPQPKTVDELKLIAFDVFPDLNTKNAECFNSIIDFLYHWDLTEEQVTTYANNVKTMYVSACGLWGFLDGTGYPDYYGAINDAEKFHIHGLY